MIIKHLLKESKGPQKTTKCGRTVAAVNVTIWWRDVNCDVCQEQMGVAPVAN
jgi:hypothetical protein